jgi:hypothetical protein
MAGIPAIPMVCSNEKRSSIFVASFVDGTSCTAIAFDKARDKVSQIRAAEGQGPEPSSARPSATKHHAHSIRVHSRLIIARRPLPPVSRRQQPYHRRFRVCVGIFH